MKLLFTGASSLLGKSLLQELLARSDYSEIWCTRHEKELQFFDPRLRIIDLDLQTEFDAQTLPTRIDQVVHLAAITRARDPDTYREVNFRGTARIAEAARVRGCRCFVYVSTRCATPAAGAYGESKLAAENELKKMDWQRLLIIQPSEIYGSGGTEGVDQLIRIGRRWHVVPMLFGSSRITFSPLHIKDFVTQTAAAIAAIEEGLRVMTVSGPEDLSGAQIARRIAKRVGGIPIPVWWPLLALLLRAGRGLGLSPVAPDQPQRLTCKKTCSAADATNAGEIRFLQN